MNNKEFKIPSFPAYIETGDVNSTDTTSFQNGDVLEFHKGREDLKPVSEIHNEAVNFAAEIPESVEVDLFAFEAKTPLQTVDVAGKKVEQMRKARAAGVEIDALAITALQRNVNFDNNQFGLTA